MECILTKTVRASCEILYIHNKSLHHSSNPIVNINYSAPALNTCSQQRAFLTNINLTHVQGLAQEQGKTDNFLHYFTLPNHIVDAWKEVKREKVRKRKQKEIRKKAEKMVRLHRSLNRVLCQSHKLNVDGRGMPM